MPPPLILNELGHGRARLREMAAGGSRLRSAVADVIAVVLLVEDGLRARRPRAPRAEAVEQLDVALGAAEVRLAARQPTCREAEEARTGCHAIWGADRQQAMPCQ